MPGIFLYGVFVRRVWSRGRGFVGSFVYGKIRPHISSYSMEPLFSEVYIIWKTKERNLFARISVSLILLRAQRNATMCWHLSADLQGEKMSCRPKLSPTETNTIFSANILQKIKISEYLCVKFIASKLQYNTNLSAL